MHRQVGLDVHRDEENIRVPLMVWTTCAYTVMTLGTETKNIQSTYTFCYVFASFKFTLHVFIEMFQNKA